MVLFLMTLRRLLIFNDFLAGTAVVNFLESALLRRRPYSRTQEERNR